MLPRCCSRRVRALILDLQSERSVTPPPPWASLPFPDAPGSRYTSTKAATQDAPILVTQAASTSAGPSSDPSASQQPLESLLDPSSRSKPKASRTIAYPKSEDASPPFLPRPLGVSEMPRSSVPEMSKEEKKKHFLSRERVMEERRHLVKEVAKGYFADLNSLRKYGGKMWIAPNTLIREDKALYFPDISGMSLSTKKMTHTTDLVKGKVSLVAMLSTRISEEHAFSFARPILEELKDEPLFQFIQLNTQENPLKNFLVSMFISSLRRSVPPPYHPSYLLTMQNLEYLREPLGVLNKYVGHVYLVDCNARIRWAGVEFARDGEGEGLRSCTRVLLDRLRSQQEQEQG